MANNLKILSIINVLRSWRFQKEANVFDQYRKKRRYAGKNLLKELYVNKDRDKKCGLSVQYKKSSFQIKEVWKIEKMKIRMQRQRRWDAETKGWEKTDGVLFKNYGSNSFLYLFHMHLYFNFLRSFKKNQSLNTVVIICFLTVLFLPFHKYFCKGFMLKR